MNHFLNIFKLFLKIKDMLCSFFLCLLSSDTIIDSKINTFFLQYEFIVIFDLFYHNSHVNLFTFAKVNEYNVAKEHFPTLCTAMVDSVLTNIFADSGISIFNRFNTIKSSLLWALENEFKTCLEKEENFYSFSHNLERKYLNHIFVVEDANNNVYSYLYDESIVDFRYLSDIVNGLKYTYYRTPLFLDTFLNK